MNTEQIIKALESLAFAEVAKEDKRWREYINWMRIAHMHLLAAASNAVNAMDQGSWQIDRLLKETVPPAPGAGGEVR